jgi:hypothetical protein
MWSQRRAARRRNISLSAIVVSAGKLVGPCVLLDVSETGARLTQLGQSDVPDRFVLMLTKDGTVRRDCEVAWRANNEIGVRFISAHPHDAQMQSLES